MLGLPVAEFALLVLSAAGSCAAALGTLYLTWRLRSRGIRGTAFTATPGATSSLSVPKVHVHAYNEIDISKYGDGRWHCGKCGEPRPED